MHLNVIDVLSLYYSHQHASATHVAIFRVISLRIRTPLHKYMRIRRKNYYKGILPPGSIKVSIKPTNSKTHKHHHKG